MKPPGRKRISAIWEEQETMHMKGENIIIVFKIKGFSLPHSKQKSVTSIHASDFVKVLFNDSYVTPIKTISVLILNETIWSNLFTRFHP